MEETSGVQEPDKSKNGDTAAASTKSPAAAPPPDELTTASACSNDDDLLIPTEKSHVHSDDESGNLLEESSYVPDDELDIDDHLKRKIGLSDDEPSSEAHFKKSKSNFYEDDDEADEEDDEFDEDDEDEFEIERHGNVHPFVNAQNRHAFESDVDSLVDDLSDGGVKSELDKSMSENGETLNISDILGEAGDDLTIDKTIKLSDIVVDPLVFSKQIGRKVKLHRADVDDDDDDDEENDDEEDTKDEEEELDFDISEKLKDMGEISVQPVSKTDSKAKKDFDLGDEVSVEITKKNASDTEDKRKISNLRKNIREVMDDNQLDASTLAAQREELERLARVQEQQRIIREVQRQIVMDRQNSKTQNRVLSLLQGRSTSLLKNSMNSGASSSKAPFSDDEGTTLTKLMSSETMPVEHSFSETRLDTNRANLTPSVSIAPVRPPVLKRDRVDVPEDDKKEQPVEQTDVKPKKDIVTIVDSSDDDCIVLSDDDEVPEEDDDPQNSGLHVNDTYNVPDDQGRVVISKLIEIMEYKSLVVLKPVLLLLFFRYRTSGRRIRHLFSSTNS